MISTTAFQSLISLYKKKMPPKRSAPISRQSASHHKNPPSSALARALQATYQSITARENQPIVRSVAMFGVSPFPSRSLGLMVVYSDY